MVHSTDPIINSFAAFANLCKENKERPYFKYDYEEVNKFFYEMKQEYPKEFEMVLFNTNGHSPYSKAIEDANGTMFLSGYLGSYAPRFQPHFVLEKALEKFNEIENQEIYLDIAKRFYDKFGCDERGEVGKHTKMKSLDDLL